MTAKNILTGTSADPPHLGLLPEGVYILERGSCGSAERRHWRKNIRIE